MPLLCDFGERALCSSSSGAACCCCRRLVIAVAWCLSSYSNHRKTNHIHKHINLFTLQDGFTFRLQSKTKINSSPTVKNAETICTFVSRVTAHVRI